MEDATRKASVTDTLYDRVKTLYSDLSYVWGNVNSLSKWDTWDEIASNLDLIRDLYPRVITCVEYCSNQIYEETKALCTSEEKRAAAKLFFDELIELNGIGEWISDLLIDWTIEAVVKAINAKYGKDWGLTSTSEVVAKANAVAVMRRKASLRPNDAAWENGKN